jgi:hypothetical protein
MAWDGDGQLMNHGTETWRAFLADGRKLMAPRRPTRCPAA